MKFGIIGSGSISSTHARAIAAMEGSALHSVYHPRAGAADALAAEHGARAYSDFEAFLADDAMEIVTIATPSGAHLEPAVAAMRAGKHVLCEKPLEVTCERIDRMIACAAETGMTLAGILNRRFNPAMEAMRDACRSQRFGQMTSASCYIKWFRDQAYYDSAAWRGTWALDGGGALMNQGIHSVDALISLAGPVVAVQAMTACLAHERIEVEDMAVAMVEFESGARGVIEGSTCSWSSEGHPARIQLCGTDGSAFLADESLEVWDFRNAHPEDAKVREQLMRRGGGGLGANDPKAISYLQHQRNFEEVVHAIHEGREPLTSAAEARKSVEVIEAIYRSAREGGVRIGITG